LGGYKDWSTGDCCLEYLKDSVLLFAPGPGHVGLCKVKEGTDYHREVIDKLVVEVGELQEGLHIYLIFWNRPFSDSRDLDRVHGYFAF